MHPRIHAAVGKLRRTDFLPVGEEQEGEVLERGYDSVSPDDRSGRGINYAFSELKDDSVSGDEQNARSEAFLEDYPGRGTPHWHLAAWIVCFGIMKLLQGRTGTAVI